jgi:hypothetical protein
MWQSLTSFQQMEKLALNARPILRMYEYKLRN